MVTKLQLHFCQEPAGLVQVGVVTPLILRPVALSSPFATPSSMRIVDHAEGAGAVPGQACKETSIAGHIAILRPIRWPVWLGCGHQCCDGVVKMFHIQGLKLAMVLCLAHDLGIRVVTPQRRQVLPGWDGAQIICGEVVPPHLGCSHTEHGTDHGAHWRCKHLPLCPQNATKTFTCLVEQSCWRNIAFPHSLLKGASYDHTCISRSSHRTLNPEHTFLRPSAASLCVKRLCRTGLEKETCPGNRSPGSEEQGL